MARHCTLEKKALVFVLHEQKMSLREISKKMGVPATTVHRIIKKYCETRNTDRNPHSGRKDSLVQGDVTFILGEVKKNPKISSSKLASLLETKVSKVVSSKTIRNRLKN
jgi:transposase